MNDAIQSRARDTLVVGLRNAHAMEQQAISVLNAQTGRLGDYPELRGRVERHIEESRTQAERLQRMLDRFDSAPSTFKDTMMSMMGAAQSSMQALADDAAIKASLADYMFEHFEIATYRSLIELSGLADMDDLRPDLEQSLREEEEMARWLEGQLPAVTRRYVELTAGGGDDRTDRAGAGEAPLGPTMSGPEAADEAVADPLRGRREPTMSGPEAMTGAGAATRSYGDVGEDPLGPTRTAERIEDNAGAAADYGVEPEGPLEDRTAAKPRPGEWPNEPRHTRATDD